MKTLVAGFLLLCLHFQGWAQRACVSSAYEQQQLLTDPGLFQKQQQALNQSLNISSSSTNTQRTTGAAVIRIPVVVHVLYNNNQENISTEQVLSQIEALNRDFRKQNADAAGIPERFSELAADVEIEFELAKVDPMGRATTGIVRKYTPVTSWRMDDKIKFASQGGSNAWDAKSYLNVWVGNLSNILGYASVIGDDLTKDGIVISHRSFGTMNVSSPFHMGRTMVHEVGHWLGLKHIWGDDYCGDDGIDDTPKQSTFTSGCPTGVRVTCGGPNGDMYMNYMDFTNDACMFMFTHGQKAKMRSLLAAGGYRHSLLESKALGTPLFEEIPTDEEQVQVPAWNNIRVYPNPANNNIHVNLEYDARWVGLELQVINMYGQVMMNKVVKGTNEQLNISHLKPGIYFIRAKKEGERLMHKFIKL